MAALGGTESPGVMAAPGSQASPLLTAETPSALERGRGGRRSRRSAPAALSPAVSVVFPGAVSRESCCRFACELLKHVLHQRHQLPLPYEQLAYFCRRAAQVGGQPGLEGGGPFKSRPGAAGAGAWPLVSVCQ